MEPEASRPYLDLQPSDKIFIDPQKNATAVLSLQNITSGNLAFKIKTNVPDSYFVRPNQGVLKPQEKMDVQLSMKTKVEGGKTHKFSVLSVPTKLDSTDTQGQLEMWKNKLPDSKQVVLSVVFPGSEDRKQEQTETDPMMASLQTSQMPIPVPRLEEPQPPAPDVLPPLEVLPPVESKPVLPAEKPAEGLSAPVILALVIASFMALNFLVKFLAR